MRPDIGDLLTGIKKTFGEVIVPALSDPFALEQATFIMLLLEHVSQRWDKARAFVEEENADLRALLTESVQRLEGRGRRSQDVEKLVSETRGQLAGQVSLDREAHSFKAIRDGNAALRDLLNRWLESLEGLEHSDGDTTVGEVVGLARAYMKRQLERDRQWVAVGEFVW